MCIKNGPPPKGHSANLTQLWEALESTRVSIPVEHFRHLVESKNCGWSEGIKGCNLILGVLYLYYCIRLYTIYYCIRLYTTYYCILLYTLYTTVYFFTLFIYFFILLYTLLLFLFLFTLTPFSTQFRDIQFIVTISSQERRSRAMRPPKHNPAKLHCFLTHYSLNQEASRTNVPGPPQGVARARWDKEILSGQTLP